MRIWEIKHINDDPYNEECPVIWIALPDDMILESINDDNNFFVIETNIRDISPGTDFILKYNQAE